MKVISENKKVHEDLQKAMINNRKLLEEKRGLLLQLKSKKQKDVDAVAALEREIHDLKRRKETLIKENTNLIDQLEKYSKKIKKLDEKDREKDEKLKKQDIEIDNLKIRMKEMEELKDTFNSLLKDVIKRGRSSGTRRVNVESTPTGSLKSETHK